MGRDGRDRRLPALAAALSLACGGAPPVTPEVCRGELAPARAGELEECLGFVVDGVQRRCGAFYADEELEEYVSSVGRRIARAASPDARWRFRVVDEDGIEAHASLGGLVTVSRGALPFFGSEAELAALLAHEVGHLHAGHLGVLGVEELPQGGELSSLLSRTHAHSRDEERQADEIAVSLLFEAGYDPLAMLSMLSAVHRARASNDPEHGGRSHPAHDARVARVAMLARGRSGGDWGRERYLRRIESLPIDLGARAPVVQGRRLGDPDGGLALELPAGWSEWSLETASTSCGGFRAEAVAAGRSLRVFGLRLEPAEGSPDAELSSASPLRVAERAGSIGTLPSGRGAGARLRGRDGSWRLVVLRADDERAALAELRDLLRRARSLPGRQPRARLTITPASRTEPLRAAVQRACPGVDPGEVATLHGQQADDELEAGEWLRCPMPVRSERGAVAQPAHPTMQRTVCAHVLPALAHVRPRADAEAWAESLQSEGDLLSLLLGAWTDAPEDDLRVWMDATARSGQVLREAARREPETAEAADVLTLLERRHALHQVRLRAVCGGHGVGSAPGLAPRSALWNEHVFARLDELRSEVAQCIGLHGREDLIRRVGRSFAFRLEAVVDERGRVVAAATRGSPPAMPPSVLRCTLDSVDALELPPADGWLAMETRLAFEASE